MKKLRQLVLMLLVVMLMLFPMAAPAHASVYDAVQCLLGNYLGYQYDQYYGEYCYYE